ncbi:MAG: dephospho-CoA kinase [Actinomycetota bacterium]|nr:dephospho-CoA kinase [Actinomycetota bacterium]
MYVVGLTGGIASGKTEVATVFTQRGAEIVDADQVARDVVRPGTPTWHKVIEHFGDEVLGPDGELHRAALGRIVFSDPAKRTLLNELTHPAVFAGIAERLEALAPFDGVVVLSVPLLVETGQERACQAVVVVTSPRDAQLRRLVERRGLSPSEARARVDAQADDERRLSVATHVVRNDGTLGELHERAGAVFDELEAQARAVVRRAPRT